jgi:hypothetical protein
MQESYFYLVTLLFCELWASLFSGVLCWRWLLTTEGSAANESVDHHHHHITVPSTCRNMYGKTYYASTAGLCSTYGEVLCRSPGPDFRVRRIWIGARSALRAAVSDRLNSDVWGSGSIGSVHMSACRTHVSGGDRPATGIVRAQGRITDRGAGPAHSALTLKSCDDQTEVCFTAPIYLFSTDESAWHVVEIFGRSAAQ